MKSDKRLSTKVNAEDLNLDRKISNEDHERRFQNEKNFREDGFEISTDE